MASSDRWLIQKLSFAFCILMLAVPSLSFAADIQVTGPGTTAAEGCYKDVGSNRWEGQGSANGYELSWANGNHLYCVLTPLGDNSTHEYYGASGDGTCDTSADFASGGTTWHVDAGTGPVPTFSETTCTGGGGGATSTATTTPEELQGISQLLFYGFALFFMSTAFTLWIFKH